MPAIATPEPGAGLALAGLAVSARQRDGTDLPILAIPDLALPAGGRVALTGPSGSGKSTLLGVLSGIVRPQAGRVVWGASDIAALSEPARDAWRRRHVGLVFQDFHLVPELDILSNILLPATFTGTGRGLRGRALALADRVGLADPRRRVGLLSRGERQRTAIARALLNEPRIILADEPTASLDRESGAGIIALLTAAAREGGATLVAATHDPALIAALGAEWAMAGGHVVGRTEPGARRAVA